MRLSRSGSNVINHFLSNVERGDVHASLSERQSRAACATSHLKHGGRRR